METLLDYMGGLKVVQGRRAGQPFEILKWQKKFLKGAFGDAVTDSVLSVARANGKTTLISAICCAALDGPLNQPNSEVVCAASSFEQSRIIFRTVLWNLQDKISDRTQWRVQDSANRALIMHRPSGASVRCCGSDPKRMHGLQPNLVIADELAQWESGKIDSALSALTTSLGKIPGSRMVSLGTRAASSDHPFEKMLNDGDSYVQVHSAAKTDKPFWRRTLLRANPSLPHMPDLDKRIATEIKRAKLDESLMQTFKALRLNQGVSDTVSNVLLDADLWARIEGDALAVGKSYWGIDLGTSAAQSAVACYWPRTGRLEVVSAFPEYPDLEARGMADACGVLYTRAHQLGELILAGENAVSIPILLREAFERFGMPSAISADTWRES